MTHLKSSFVLFYNQIKTSENTHTGHPRTCASSLPSLSLCTDLRGTNGWKKGVPLGRAFLCPLASTLGKGHHLGAGGGLEPSGALFQIHKMPFQVLTRCLETPGGSPSAPSQLVPRLAVSH